MKYFVFNNPKNVLCIFARGIAAEPRAALARRVMERIARRERAKGARSGSPKGILLRKIQ
jgi:hypothetical protein